MSIVNVEHVVFLQEQITGSRFCILSFSAECRWFMFKFIVYLLKVNTARQNVDTKSSQHPKEKDDIFTPQIYNDTNLRPSIDPPLLWAAGARVQ